MIHFHSEARIHDSLLTIRISAGHSYKMNGHEKLSVPLKESVLPCPLSARTHIEVCAESTALAAPGGVINKLALFQQLVDFTALHAGELSKTIAQKPGYLL